MKVLWQVDPTYAPSIFWNSAHLTRFWHPSQAPPTETFKKARPSKMCTSPSMLDLAGGQKAGPWKNHSGIWFTEFFFIAKPQDSGRGMRNINDQGQVIEPFESPLAQKPMNRLARGRPFSHSPWFRHQRSHLRAFPPSNRAFEKLTSFTRLIFRKNAVFLPDNADLLYP